MSDLKKNFIYNIIYQLLTLIIPLITIPYVSRILGADGIGIYSYTYSIVYYFMIFAMLGFNNYGVRTIAKVRDDPSQLSKTFLEIYSLQVVISLVMIILYFFYNFFFVNQYQLVSFLQILYLFSCLFDVKWFFFGIEKFKLTITRNIVVKFLTLIGIFLFVKTSDDVYLYPFILGGGTLLSQLLLFLFLKANITLKKISFYDIKKHFFPCLKLFLPVIAVTIYKVMDKTMIGWFANMSEVGYYESAEKIINVPIAIINALGTIMLPRMSYIYSKGNVDQAKNVIQKSIEFIMFLAFPMTLGLTAISKDFSILFFGEEFAKTGIIIIFLSVTILFLSWGSVIRTQYLIPKNMDREYIISAFLGAIVNLILNLIFIPKFQAVGACIGTIVAELFVVVYQTYKVRKQLPILNYVIASVNFMFKSFIMFFFLVILGKFNITGVTLICLQLVLGVLIYCILNVSYIKKYIKFAVRREGVS